MAGRKPKKRAFDTLAAPEAPSASVDVLFASAVEPSPDPVEGFAGLAGGLSAPTFTAGGPGGAFPHSAAVDSDDPFTGGALPAQFTAAGPGFPSLQDLGAAAGQARSTIDDRILDVNQPRQADEDPEKLRAAAQQLPNSFAGKVLNAAAEVPLLDTAKAGVAVAKGGFTIPTSVYVVGGLVLVGGAVAAYLAARTAVQAAPYLLPLVAPGLGPAANAWQQARQQQALPPSSGPYPMQGGYAAGSMPTLALPPHQRGW